jgi:hypothetical protein
MNRLYFIVLLLLSGMILPVQGQDFGKGEWISLFNGKDLEDWIIKFTGHELMKIIKILSV